MPTTKMIIEGVGYLGSFLVVISMLMTSVKKLRIVNTVGSVIFTTYALIIQSYPTALMNLCLICINLYQLYKLERKDKIFSLIRSAATAGPLLYLTDYYIEDICRFFPDFTKEKAIECDAAFLVLFGTAPAGILLGNYVGEDTVDVMLDYAMPEYRDCSVGRFLYARLPEQGVRRLRYNKTLTPAHEKYLLKLGFVRNGDELIKEL
jgi:hypothetical protein